MQKHAIRANLLAAFAICIIAGLYNPLAITRYVIADCNITAQMRIVLLTDLHSCSYGAEQKQLVEAICAVNPDAILMSGDIADDALPDGKTKELLDAIAHQYPCYYVTGNHEFWSQRVEEQKEMFRSYGVTVLEGTRVHTVLNGQAVDICGLDDPDVGAAEFQRQCDALAEAIEEEKYTILLSHRPERFLEYVALGADLVVSGHAHGGQWSFPLILPNGLYAPNQGLFPRYTRGVHKDNGTVMVVSRGLAKESTRIPRFFNPPEIVVIELLPK